MLQGQTQYWFYTDAMEMVVSNFGSAELARDDYPGGDAYSTGTANGRVIKFHNWTDKPPEDLNFELHGRRVSTREP